MTPESIGAAAHVNPDTLAMYLDDALPGEERRGVESHLVACDECRAEAIAAQEAVAGAPAIGARRSSMWRMTGIVAAAGLLVLVGTTLTRKAGVERVERGPGGSRANQPAVAIVTPDDGAVIGSDRMLVWKSVSPGASYRVIIGDAAARQLYSATVQDTSIVIPGSVKLPGGEKLLWYVDAIASDGRTATSGLKSFTVK